MLAALRARLLNLSSPSSPLHQSWKLGFSASNRSFCSPTVDSPTSTRGFLELNEVEKVLSDIRADDVKVIPVNKRCDWADYVVIATGRSAWHVRNIAQAIIYKVKQKQRGAERMILPSVEGQEGGTWVVIDSGKVIIHALDENARAYYNLENLWTSEAPEKDSIQDLEQAFVKIRPRNNSKKKPAKRHA